MKCCFVGNQRAPWCTEVHLTKTLQSLGHEVVFLQEDEVPNAVVIETANRCDLAIFVHTWGWGQLDVATIKSIKCPTIYPHLDLIRGIPDRENTVDSSWWYKCDFVFMPDGDPASIKWFREKGVNYYFAPPAVFEGGCYLADPDPTLIQDVCFIGSKGYHPEWPHRRWLLEHLEERYQNRFTLYEHSSQMREHKLNVLYASVKIAVGDTFCPGFTRRLYFSDRLFECAGRSGFQIFPYIQGIERYFDLGKELVCYHYNDWDELFGLIDYYLSHDSERESIRRAGFERVKREHTYTNRLKNMLGVVLHGDKNIYE